MGSHVYPVAADVAMRVAGEPAQTIVGTTAAAMGRGPTVTVVAAVELPHPFVPVTVYTEVEVGVKVWPLTTPPVQL